MFGIFESVSFTQVLLYSYFCAGFALFVCVLKFWMSMVGVWYVIVIFLVHTDLFFFYVKMIKHLLASTNPNLTLLS